MITRKPLTKRSEFSMQGGEPQPVGDGDGLAAALDDFEDLTEHVVLCDLRARGAFGEGFVMAFEISGFPRFSWPIAPAVSLL